MPRVFKSRGSAQSRPLPAAGHARNEEMLRRRDELEAEAAHLNETVEAGAGRPLHETVVVENELAQHFNELDVANAQPGFHYSWVYTGRAGFFIKQKSIQGWQVVQGDMPEARELMGIGADTTRRLGDVILMRCTNEVYAKIQRYNQTLIERQRLSVAGGLEELGARYAGRGVKVHTTLDTLDPRTAKHVADRAVSQQLATKKLDSQIRQGTVPGMEAHQ